jgi:hypothetical protein
VLLGVGCAPAVVVALAPGDGVGNDIDEVTVSLPAFEQATSASNNIARNA